MEEKKLGPRVGMEIMVDLQDGRAVVRLVRATCDDAIVAPLQRCYVIAPEYRRYIGISGGYDRLVPSIDDVRKSKIFASPEEAREGILGLPKSPHMVIYTLRGIPQGG